LEKTPKIRLEGISPGTGRIIKVCCPLCHWSHQLFKSGRAAIERGKSVLEPKGFFRFDTVDLDTAPFIDVRDATGGRGGSFKRIKEQCLTLKQALGKEEYQGLIISLKNQIKNIQKILENVDNS